MTRRRTLLGLLVVGLGLCGCGTTATAGSGADSGSARPATTQEATIAYAVDGDTLRVRLGGELVYVRLVGIDTPEDVRPGSPVECGARSAAASLDELAPEGVGVVLRSDSVAAKVDRYGRLLAHGLVDGSQLEVVQLRRGWATVYRYRGQRFDGLDRFRRAEKAAQLARRGVWKLCGGDFHAG